MLSNRKWDGLTEMTVGDVHLIAKTQMNGPTRHLYAAGQPFMLGFSPARRHTLNQSWSFGSRGRTFRLPDRCSCLAQANMSSPESCFRRG